MRRILVTGNAGAGKTTFAARLAARLSMPVLGLDAIVWRPGWVKAPRALGRALRRSLRDPLGTRPGLPPGCPEFRILPELVRIIWAFPTRVRAPLLADAAGWGPERSLVVLRSDQESEAFLAGVPPR